MNHILKFFASQYIGTGGGKVRATDEQLRYLIRSQLMLLQTDKLKEICTVPPRDTGHVCAPPHTVRVAAAHNMHAARNTIFGTEILERDRSLETFDVIGY